MKKNKSKPAKTQRELPKFKRSKYQITFATPNYEVANQIVSGFIAEGSPLAYRQIQSSIGGELVAVATHDSYSIDHLPTGYRIGEFNSRSQAREFIQKALSLDWNFTKPNSPKLAKLGPVVKGLIVEIRCRHGEETVQ